MEINFVTKFRLSKELEAKLEAAFGFELTFDCDDAGGYEYFFGYSQDGLKEGEEDLLPYDEAVRCCGVLEREGIESYAIEGNGGWAMGMIKSMDFSHYAVDDATKQEWARTAAIFWGEADPAKLLCINPRRCRRLAPAGC